MYRSIAAQPDLFCAYYQSAAESLDWWHAGSARASTALNLIRRGSAQFARTCRHHFG